MTLGLQSLHEYQMGVQTLYVHDLPEETPRLYKRAGTETDPEALAAYDGPVLYDGKVVRFDEQDGTDLIVACHGWTGIVARFTPRDEIEAVKLREVDRP